MSIQTLVDHFKEAFDPVPWMRPIPHYRGARRVRRWPEQPLAYWAAVPASSVPDPNLYAVYTEQILDTPPSDETTLIWDLLAFMALQSEPLVSAYWNQLDVPFTAAEDAWKQFKKTPAYAEVLTVLAFRVEALLARCRELLIKALEAKLAFSTTGINVVDDVRRQATPSWWVIPGAGFSVSTTPLRLVAVPFAQHDAWVFAKGLAIHKQHPATQSFNAFAGPDHTTGVPFLVSKEDTGEFPQVLTNVGRAHR